MAVAETDRSGDDLAAPLEVRPLYCQMVTRCLLGRPGITYAGAVVPGSSFGVTQQN